MFATKLLSLQLSIPFFIFQCRSCPAPIGQYLSVNSQPHTSSTKMIIKTEKVQNMNICKIKVEDNLYYKSPKCSGRLISLIL